MQYVENFPPQLISQKAIVDLQIVNTIATLSYIHNVKNDSVTKHFVDSLRYIK